MTQELNVLIIEDNKDDALLTTRALREMGQNVRFNRVDTEIALREALHAQKWDLIICDYALPRFNGLVALKIIRELIGDIPFILLSGTIGEEAAAAAVKAGANDYVMKGNLSRLVPAAQRELRDAGMRADHLRSQQAIREIDERNRAIITAAADGILTFDSHGMIDSINPAAERIFGYPASEVVGNCLSVLIPDWLEVVTSCTTLDSLEEIEPQIACEGNNGFRESVGQHRNGTQVPIEVAVSKIRFGEKGLFTAILHDLTKRKADERQIRLQLERISALRAIDVAITGSFDLRVTLSIVLDQVVNLLGVDASDILLFDETSGELICAAVRGFLTDAVRRSRLRLGQGLAGKAASMRRMVESANLATDPIFSRPSMVSTEGFVSYCALPLVAKGQIQGVLEVFHRDSRVFDADWCGYFEVLGGQAAIAIDSAMMFESLQKQNAELTIAYDVTIEGWARALDLRDKETEGHSRRVSELTVQLAREFGIPDKEIVHIRRGALLHDIGKLGVPDNVLRKPGPLTDDEWVIMRKHPQYAYEWLCPVEFLKRALEIPLCHHEKWDGSGYPQGLAGEAIPLPARLFAIVDVWDALTSDRPYRAACTAEKTLEHLQSQSGVHFDPSIVETFVRLIRSEAEADDGKIGEAA